jgi:hypothetical protein
MLSVEFSINDGIENKIDTKANDYKTNAILYRIARSQLGSASS